MGEAKRRGTYEQRKARALAIQDEKRKARLEKIDQESSNPRPILGVGSRAAIMAAMIAAYADKAPVLLIGDHRRP